MEWYKCYFLIMTRHNLEGFPPIQIAKELSPMYKRTEVFVPLPYNLFIHNVGDQSMLLIQQKKKISKKINATRFVRFTIILLFCFLKILDTQDGTNLLNSYTRKMPKSHGTMGVGVGVCQTAAMKDKGACDFFSVFSFAFLHNIG